MSILFKKIFLVFKRIPNTLRYKTKIVLLLLTLSVILEGLTVSSVFPFLLVYTDPSALNKYPFIQDILPENLSLSEKRFFLFLIFIASIFSATAIKIYSIVRNISLGQLIGNYLAGEIIQQFVKKNFIDQEEISSSFLLGIIISKINEVVEKKYYSVSHTHKFFMSIVAILVVVSIFQGVKIIVVGAVIACLYIFITSILKNKLKEKSNNIAISVTDLTQKVYNVKYQNIQIKLNRSEKTVV